MSQIRLRGLIGLVAIMCATATGFMVDVLAEDWGGRWAVTLLVASATLVAVHTWLTVRVVSPASDIEVVRDLDRQIADRRASEEHPVEQNSASRGRPSEPR